MALSLIVFDCDGVILESLDIKTLAFRRIGETFGQEAADRLVLYHRLHGGVSRYKKFEWLYQEYLGRSITEEEKAALNKRFVSIALDELTRCALVPGVLETLDAWKGRALMYVASGAPQEELAFVLERRGLDRYFDGVCGYPPTKTALLKEILRETGAKPAETVMVGDSSTDLNAAEYCGTLFYGRGETFKDSPWPWHEDMTRLSAWLEERAKSPPAR